MFNIYRSSKDHQPNATKYDEGFIAIEKDNNISHKYLEDGERNENSLSLDGGKNSLQQGDLLHSIRDKLYKHSRF